MKGRIEHKQKSEQHMRQLLIDKPTFVLDFYEYLLVSKEYLTAKVYVKTVLRFIDFLEFSGKSINENNFQELNVRNLNKFVLSMKGKKSEESTDSAKIQVISALKSFAEYLVKVDIISKNPFLDIKQSNKDKPKQVYLDGDELKSLIKKIEDNSAGSEIEKARRKRWIKRNSAIFRILITTGIRVTALTELNIEDFNPEERTIEVIDKRRTSFVKTLDETTAETIKEWIIDRERILQGEHCDALFISNRKTRITSKAVGDLVTSYCTDFDKRITPHKFRSSFASNYYLGTKDIVGVQKLLGHQNIETTQRYTNGISVNSLEAANFMNDLLK